ncbi:hypothetical protein [Streptococcus sp. S784/96/1]|uniref:hypothetical protein n=1 Tax=Streptococcus sp. S784/96/1 TaxID=2653499 RepID=UPI0013869AD1|nr:hypothetical protein [Streptococcus sp. S784/96/1]
MLPMHPFMLICWFTLYSIGVWFTAPQKMPYRKLFCSLFIVSIGLLMGIYYMKTSADLSETLINNLYWPVTISAYYSLIPLVVNTLFQLSLQKADTKTWVIWLIAILLVIYLSVGLIQNIFLGAV